MLQLYSLLTAAAVAAAAAAEDLTGAFFLGSVADDGAIGFLFLFVDDGFGFVLAAAFGRTGKCWSSVYRTSPLLGRWAADDGKAQCAATSAAAMTSRHSLRFAIISQMSRAEQRWSWIWSRSVRRTRQCRRGLCHGSVRPSGCSCRYRWVAASAGGREPVSTVRSWCVGETSATGQLVPTDTI